MFPAILGIAVLAACYEAPELPDAEALLAPFDEPLTAASAPAPARPSLQIYIDGSRSMQGFVAVRNSNFQRRLDQLLDQAVAGGYDVSVLKFDQTVTPLPGTTSTGSILAPGFFVGDETSFPQLFDHVRKARKPGSIALVVTDLVQSSRTGEQRELSRGFQELAKDRPEVLLLALRSTFVGPYWPESTTEKDRIEVALRGHDVRSSRPFYLLVVADRAEDLPVLRRHLRLTADAGAPASWEIDASRPAIVIKGSRLDPSSDEATATWRELRESEELPPVGRSHRAAFWLTEVRAPSADAAPLRLRLIPDGEIGVRELAHLEVEAQRCRFDRSSSCATAEPIDLDHEILQPDDSGALVATYALARPPDGSWDLYRVRLLAGRANLDSPIDVSLWTTDDDSVVQNAARTYKLDLFVDTLINALRGQVALSEQFILLARGE